MHHKACEHCSTEDKEDLELIANLPFPDLILETEEHVLMECPRFDEERKCLKHTMNNALHTNIKSIFEGENIKETARYIRKIFNKRFPKKISQEVSTGRKDTMIKKKKKKKKEKKKTNEK